MTRHHMLVPTLLLSFLGAAQATTSANTVGFTTTYTDNFNDAPTMFTVVGGAASGVINAGPDDYLLLVNNASASFSFSSAVPISSVAVSFWYSQNDTGARATLNTTTINLSDTTAATTLGGAGQFAFNNPGLGGDPNDSFNTSLALNNLAAGTYTLTFAAPPLAGNLTGVKIDDVSIAVTAVPEPSAYAMMLTGLGVLTLAARRRRNKV